MAAARVHPFRHAIFLTAVRSRLVRELVAAGTPREEALATARDLDTDVIEEAAVHFNGGEAPTVGAGGIIAAIIAFLTSPAFAQLIAFLLSLFAGTAVPETPAPPPA